MNPQHIRLAAFAAVCILAGCASQPPATEVASAQPQAKECVKTTGTNICRAQGSGNPNNVNSISGEDLRRSGGPITGPTPGKVSN